MGAAVIAMALGLLLRRAMDRSGGNLPGFPIDGEVVNKLIVLLKQRLVVADPAQTRNNFQVRLVIK